MGGEHTPRQPFAWHETKEPGVFIDPRLLPFWARAGRLASAAWLFVYNNAQGLSDEATAKEFLDDMRDLNQRIITKRPDAASPNPATDH